MAPFDEQGPSGDLRRVEEALRAVQPTFTELDLDQLKCRALARTSNQPSCGRRRARKAADLAPGRTGPGGAAAGRHRRRAIYSGSAGGAPTRPGDVSPAGALRAAWS